MNRKARHGVRAVLAVSLALGLSACMGGTTSGNGTLESVHQPVVERTNYTLDVYSGPDGVPLGEQRRVAGWFDALGLRYGDRIGIDDPQASSQTRRDLEAIAARYGLLVGNDAPSTPGLVEMGKTRLVVTRSMAKVDGCGAWDGTPDSAFTNNSSSNYGCATNSNLAAMVADPEHLVRGATGTGNTVVMSSDKAITSYRNAKPTGEDGLKANQTSEEGK